ncbi:MAG TPA: ATP-binding protein [Candidatus Binataceae bacterium]|nr:ATP-binding protein [Candidatus Binataceae bacterium]
MLAGSIKLTIESRLENGALVGVAVNHICREAGLSEQEAFKVELCVVEAVNNCIRHAYRERPGNEVEVHFALTPQAVIAKVADTGRTLPPQMLQRPAPPGHEAPLADSGRGLFIIQSLMDEVTYQSAGGRNVLSMTRHLDALASRSSATPSPGEFKIGANPRSGRKQDQGD